jgi:predicted NBD/HSP70 family sugar kinase
MYVLLDIGGTKTRIATTDSLSDDITIVDKFATKADPATACKEIVSKLEKKGIENVRATCVAIAGTVDTSAGKLLCSPNLPDWIGFNLEHELAKRLEADVNMANDTDLGALGEAHRGVGEGADILGYLTVGTGVGGSRVVDGEIDAGTYGFEPGHQIMKMDEFLEATKQADTLPDEGHIPGHLEYYLSGANIERQTGKEAVKIKDEQVWELFQDRLAAALSNVAVMWSPDEIVLGGSMIIRNEFLSFAYLQKSLERQLKVFPEVPTLQRAQLQDKAGLFGAQVYLKQKAN